MVGTCRRSFLFFSAVTLYVISVVNCHKRLQSPGTHGLEWVDASWSNVSSVCDLVEGGYESSGKPVYVCRASDAAFGQGVTVSGWLSVERAVCFVVYQGTAYALSGYYQVLTNPRRRFLRWLGIDEGDWTANQLQDYLKVAVSAAYLRDEETYIYVGRFKDEQLGIHPGYVYNSNKKFLYIEDSKFTAAKQWKSRREDTPVKTVYKYELLVAEAPDQFQLINRDLLTNSNGLTWEETNYTALTTVKSKIEGGRLNDGTRTFFCRSLDHNQNSKGALYPGLVSEKTGACYVDFEGQNNTFVYLSRYQVLTNVNNRVITWEKHSGGDVGDLKTAVVGGRNSEGSLYYIARRDQQVGRLSVSEGEFQFCDPGDDLYPVVFYYRQHYKDHPCRSDDAEYEVMHSSPSSDSLSPTPPQPTTQNSANGSQTPIFSTTTSNNQTSSPGDDY